MNIHEYVTAILKQVKGPRKLKKRLKEDLTQDIEARIATGETIEDVVADMGSAEKVAREIQREYPVRPRTVMESVLLVVAVLSAGVAACTGIVVAVGFIKSLFGGGITSVGIIGGADGPTAIYTTTHTPISLIVLGVVLVILVIAVLLYCRLRKRK